MYEYRNRGFVIRNFDVLAILNGRSLLIRSGVHGESPDAEPRGFAIAFIGHGGQDHKKNRGEEKVNKLKFSIPFFLLGFGVVMGFMTRSKSKDEALKDDKEPLNEADLERKKLMSEMGKKGAQKSAEVRKKKAAAKKAAKDDVQT